MRSPIAALSLICVLFLSGITSFAGTNRSKQQKARKASTATKQARSKRESRKELATKRELLKRNSRLSGLFKEDSEIDVERFDQPREALEWYLQKRLPKGEKQLPVERYFEAKEKIKQMKRFSTASRR